MNDNKKLRPKDWIAGIIIFVLSGFVGLLAQTGFDEIFNSGTDSNIGSIIGMLVMLSMLFVLGFIADRMLE